MVLAHRQVRLVQARVAAHHQAVHFLPAQIPRDEPLARVEAVAVAVCGEPQPGHLVERIEIIQPQPLTGQQCPFLERRILEQLTPIELKRFLVPGERAVLVVGRLLARGTQSIVEGL